MRFTSINTYRCMFVCMSVYVSCGEGNALSDKIRQSTDSKRDSLLCAKGY